MKTAALSVRMDVKEAREVDACAKLFGMDRSALLKQLVRTGLRQTRMEQAVRAYRDREVSLSKAAENAGISVRDFLSRMGSAGLEFNYDVAEFESDLEGLPS